MSDTVGPKKQDQINKKMTLSESIKNVGIYFRS